MDRHSVSPCETLAEQYQALLEVSEAIAVHRDLSELFRDLAKRLHRVVLFDHMRLLLYDPERHTMRLKRTTRCSRLVLFDHMQPHVIEEDHAMQPLGPLRSHAVAAL